MKQVYSYQEIGTEIDKGKSVVFTSHPVARVTAVKKSRKSELITVTIQLSIGDICIGIVENEFSSVLDVLEAFNINDLEEMWVVLE